MAEILLRAHDVIPARRRQVAARIRGDRETAEALLSGRAGRPHLMSDASVRRAQQALAFGVPLRHVARRFGVCVNTLKAAVARPVSA